MTNSEFNQTRKDFGKKLLEARKQLHLKQQEVADAAGVHVNYYARIERGVENPSFEKLQSIMKVLKIKSFDLL